MIEKDFAKVAELYSTAVPTFTSFSVFSFNDLVKYAVITGIMYLPRPVLKSRLVSQSCRNCSYGDADSSIITSVL